MKSLVAATLIVLVFFSVVLWRQNTYFPEFTNPDNDVKRAIAAKDFRFQGLAGFGVFFPGVSESVPDAGTGNPWVTKYGYNVIPKTSDYLRGWRDINYNRQANRYAERYNRLLLQHLKAVSPTSLSSLSNSTKIVLAARQQIGTSYTQEYFSIKYPGGDVPKDRGACTDVIVRALRATGRDLQKLIHEDMKRNFSAYPSRKKWGLTRTDKNIDHRRVPNQMVFFRRFGRELTKDVSAKSRAQWQAGDIICWDLNGNNLTHTGIVSDKTNAQGWPLVIHNIGGCREEDALTAWKIIGHFRYPK